MSKGYSEFYTHFFLLKFSNIIWTVSVYSEFIFKPGLVPTGSRMKKKVPIVTREISQCEPIEFEVDTSNTIDST